ncbi:PREDICTED: nose resistant to fluoxetine protein 6-like isoform X2 [Nicrophorus vespilloides]|uniref:Nose resistant to fluoxetine protein 6-like isoform X2 n=1 Tax=Nicrophorus vespilloides TaxID=110193 RepID=A0ABM1MP56_NICVS|nr:PREDICTED: nose resistant to fluoxetine protein 6-like isoform X2 [Nicrophorus vespilloides]
MRIMNILILALISAHGVYSFDFLNVGSLSVKRKLEHVLEDSEETACKNDLSSLMHDFYSKKTWAMKMIDAAGKPSSGIMFGNIMQSGNYDECMSINHNLIKGKYCTTIVKPIDGFEDVTFLKNGNSYLKALGVDFDRKNVTEVLDNIRWTWGFCIPLSCNQFDIQKIVNKTRDYLNIKFNFQFDDKYCTSSEKDPLTAKAIFGILLFLLIGIIITASTVYDIRVYKKTGDKADILIAFSLYSNAKKLFSTQVSADNLGVVNGVRALSMTWVLLGHTFMVNLFFPSVNSIEIFDWKNHLYNVFVLAAPLAVDTFFALSGFLVVYVYFKSIYSNRKITWSMFYIHRILRLTPSLAMIIVFYLCILELLGEGPYWFAIKELYVRNCEKHWWSTLIYIQNYYNSLGTCVNQSWYLAVDTQLYFIAPVILYYLKKHAMKTLIAIAIVFSISALTAFSVSYNNYVGAAPFEAGSKYFTYLYHPTHIRMTAWLVGTVWGYILFRTKDVDLKIKKFYIVVIWAVHVILMIIIALSHVTMTRYSNPYDPLTAAFFNSLARPTWAWCICWLMFACIKGYGGILNDILSCKLFMIIARLNYSMFLVHLPIMLIFISQKRSSIYLSNLFICFDFWAYFTMTIAVSIPWTLAFESPIIVLERVLFSKNKKSQGFPKNGITNNLTIVDITDIKSKNIY